ncbi:PIN domain-containing protein [Streptomyces olindensis]|uniref:PIN domain-containing protein n=1 Tax=Streptomyces olindensis TaxID=358823 RepID=A0ABV2XLR4_9ACTN
MIILDTNILQSVGLDSVSSDLLKTIRTAGVESVGVPWVVLEELVSHQSVPYRKKHEKAGQAMDAFERATPWPVTAVVPPLELERFREHCRQQYRAVVNEIPTTESALREAAFREANVLPPCKTIVINERGKEVKTGGRDAAIWLTAIEYARNHPEETVYFVSRDKDFRDGTTYRPPMDKDLEGIRHRFVHMTSIDEVVEKFATPTEIEEDAVRAILARPEMTALVAAEAMRALPVQVAYLAPSSLGLFECTPASVLNLSTGPQADLRPSPVVSAGWLRTPTAVFDSVRDMEARSIDDHVWCMAWARWLLGGPALVRGEDDGISVGCSWETRVLISPTSSTARLTLLRTRKPQGITAAEFSKLPESSVAPRTLYALPRTQALEDLKTALAAVRSAGGPSAVESWFSMYALGRAQYGEDEDDG